MTGTNARRGLLLRRAVAALSGVLMVAVLFGYLLGSMSLVAEDLGQLVAALLAAVSCALAARAAAGRLRRAWAALAGACLAWAVGEGIWSTYELLLHTDTPFPSVADIGFLGFPVGALVALALFPAGATRADRRRMTLDGLMVASATGLISWAIALGPAVHAGEGSLLATVVSVAYPLSDIALLVFCVLVLSRSRSHRVPLAFIAGGLALMSFSDSAFAYLSAQGSYSTGNPVDLGWFLAFGLLALAPLTPGATDNRPPSDDVAVAGALLPYVPLAAALGFLGWHYVDGHSLSPTEMSLAAVLLLLVLTRQFLTVRDNQQLARALSIRETELRHQAFHDTLTGLANRALYVDRVAHAIELHRRDARSVAICFLDLDGFKKVNDTLGHAAGDELLRQVAHRLRRVLSDADTLARLGGDEFAVLLEDHPDPENVARELLASLRLPFVLDDHRLTMLASVGVATVGLLDETPTVDELLTRADIAMYIVKRRGKADVLLHSADMRLEDLDDITLGPALARALGKQEISVVFQPIVDLANGHVHTLEALARWAPNGRALSPEVFVRVAERTNLIDQLFAVVLESACAQLARWTALPGGAEVRVAVNLSPRQLATRAVVPAVLAALTRHGLAPERLVLEITESEGLVDTEATNAVCHELRQLGVHLSVDDFGTGLSSLARLRDLPIDEVKIDRSFVCGVERDPGRRRFVRGVLAFAGEVGLSVVAEGVENEAERAALAQLGCHLAQGYLFSRPVPGDAVDALLVAPVSPQIPYPRGMERTLQV